MGHRGYIIKPLNMDEVLAVITKALEKQRLVMENRRLYQEAQRELAERKKAEEALRESEEKYRSILESIEEGYYEVDIAGSFTFVNDSACKILGYSKDELKDMNKRQFMDPENAKKAHQTF